MFKEFLNRLMAMAFSRIIAFLVLGALVGVYTIYRAVSYTPTDAVVTAVETDCYIEDSQAELRKNESNERAYMPCDLAPAAAKEYKFADSAIKKRSIVTYRFVSPVDKQSHTDTYTASPAYQTFRVGEVYAVLAHKSDAKQSSWGTAKEQKEATARRTASASVATPVPVVTASAVSSVKGLRGKL
jgi:hypothetical protein